MPELRFAILPILGLKTDVPANDASLFKPVAENVFATHAVEGYNFNISRKRNSCSKSLGTVQWSASATAQATKCLGLFELYDGTNRDHLIWDNGKLYAYDSNKAPVDVTTAATTYQQADSDLVSMIQVGSHVVFTDNIDGVTIQSWKNADANAQAAITGGTTAFKFRYLEYFARRILGVRSNETNGDIDIRWSNALPVPATSCQFESGVGLKDYQLYVPNDDPLTGVKKLGHNSCFIYSENSIHQLNYYPNFTIPFEIYTVVQGQGCTGHHSIVSLGDRHFFFNKNYGFCEYAGGNQVRPIADDIDDQLAAINSGYYNLIVGAWTPTQDEVVWTLPTEGSSTPNNLAIYNYRSGQWRFKSVDVRYLDTWETFTSYTWNNLVADVIAAGYANATWNDVLSWLGSNVKWLDFASPERRTVLSNTNGQVYQVKGASDPTSASHTAYRVEPIMDFGNPTRKKLIRELWFDFGVSGDFSVKVWHRSGDTVGELESITWDTADLIGTVSCNSEEVPALRGEMSKSAKFHQFKWGNETNDSQFEVNRLTFIAEMQGY